MYPTLIVLAGYLAADFLFSGFTAAIAVFSLGLGEFLFLLVFRKSIHPVLIMEGAVLAAAGLAGDWLAGQGYGGAGYVLLELILSGVLLISTARGKPWLDMQMKRITGVSAGSGISGEISRIMGLLFLLHGSFLAVLTLTKGRIEVVPAILSFILLYLLSIVYLRKKQRQRIVKNAPRLLKTDDGKIVIELAGRELGRMLLQPGAVSVATEIEISDECQIHTFLENVELYLKARGCRALRFPAWEGDELPLEMSGYMNTPTGWNKIL
jgi:hypothetical protein